MGIAVFRKGRRARIEIVIILAEGFPYRQVGVAVKEDVPFLKGRQAVRIVVVAVGCIDDEGSPCVKMA